MTKSSAMWDQGRVGTTNGWRRSVGVLASSTDVTGRHKCLYLRSVPPSEDFSSDGNWHEQTVRRIAPRIRISFLSAEHLCFNLPGKGTQEAGRRKDGLRVGTWSRGVAELAGERVGAHVLGTGLVGDGEVEPCEEQGPS